MKVKSESEVAQSSPTLSDPMDCSLPGPSIHEIFQARVLEWGAITFSAMCVCVYIYPNVLFLWRILIESYTSPFESLEESISRVPWPSVGLRSAESGLCKKRHVKFTKVVGHMFLWVLS